MIKKEATYLRGKHKGEKRTIWVHTPEERVEAIRRLELHKKQNSVYKNKSNKVNKIMSNTENKSYPVYDVTEDGIKDVAERHELSLKGVDLDDIAHYVQKGIEVAIADVREQIIKEAIRMAGGKKIDE
jgi:hypothetical protein